MPIAQRSSQPATWREWALVVGGSALLIVVLTWPLLPEFGSGARTDSGDGRFSVWNVGWVDHALLTDPRHLLDANIFAPHLGTLAYSEMNLVAGVLGLPAYLATHNAVAAHNCAVLLSFLLTAICTWLLVRRLTGSSGAGFISAILFTFCSFVAGHTAHIQLLMTFVVPLVLLALQRLDDAPTVKNALLFGGSLVVAGLACGYYGIYGGLFAGGVALAIARRDYRYWVALAGAAVTALVLILPFVVPYVHARDIPQVASGRTNPDLQISASPSDYLASASVLENMVKPESWAPNPHEFLSPGIIALGLAIFAFGGGAWARRRGETRMLWVYLGVTLLAVWASLGPAYGLYGLFMRVVPGIEFLRAPCRIGITVAFGVAVLAGFGAERVLKGRTWLLVPLVLVCALDRYVGPWPLQADPIPQVYRVLATLPPGVVVDFPFPYMMNGLHWHTRPMYYSTADWMPRVNGYSDVLPEDFVQIAAPINDFPTLSSFALMRRYNVRYVVWRLQDYRRPSRVFDTLAARFPAASPYIRRIYADPVAWLYEIVAWPPEAEK